MKVTKVFGTRPEAIKLGPVIRELQQRSTGSSPRIVVCVTAQHRLMLDQVLCPLVRSPMPISVSSRIINAPPKQPRPLWLHWSASWGLRRLTASRSREGTRLPRRLVVECVLHSGLKACARRNLMLEGARWRLLDSHCSRSQAMQTFLEPRRSE